MSPDVIVVVDVANVMGSRPDGWWRDRKAAATRLLTALSQLIWVDTIGPDGGKIRIARVVAVLEGAARGAVAPVAVRVNDVSETVTSNVSTGTDDSTGSSTVEVVEADRDGDTAIVAVTEKLISALAVSPEITDVVTGVLVVTADRGLRRRLPRDTMIVGPEWVNRLIHR